MALPSISVCYIVKNEVALFAASLRSVMPFASEVIVVDTGSTDATLDIAKSFNARIEIFKWIDDFSAARNFAASFGKKDWILFVDGDEILETSAAQKIEASLQDHPDTFAFGVLQRNYTNERSLPGWRSISEAGAGEISPLAKGLSGFADNLMMKFYQNGKGILWEGVVHETFVGTSRKLGLKHLEIPICIFHHLNALKTEEFQNEKKLYYLKLALEKLKGDPHHENPWFEVGISLNNLGRFEEAEKSFREALLRRPDWDEAKLFRARALLHLEQTAAAEIILRELLSNPMMKSEAEANLTTALLYQGKFDECEQVIQSAFSEGQGHLSLHINAGTLYFEKGQFDKSKHHFETALMLNPSDPFLKEAVNKANSAAK